MRSEFPNTEWNEIQFLSWKEFKQMAPAILRLEVKRIGSVIDGSAGDDSRNSLVRGRFELERFVECLEVTERPAFKGRCAKHLHAAIMNVSVQVDDLEAPARETCRYVLDRLRYVCDRMELLY